MGIESYFLHLVPEHEGNSVKLADWLIIMNSDLGKINVPYKYLRAENKLIIDRNIEVTLDYDNGLFQEVILVGCMSWYEEGIGLCYQIARAIHSWIPVRAVIGKENSLSLDVTEKEFSVFMYQIFDKKHLAFLETFGDFKLKTTAGESFYTKYRLSKSSLGRIILNFYSAFGS